MHDLSEISIENKEFFCEKKSLAGPARSIKENTVANITS